MENQRLDRYVGNYDKFQEVYAVKKSQLEAAYRKQQQEISELKDFVARNKARVATRNMAMSRQKKLDKMDVIELAAERPKPELISNLEGHRENISLRPKILSSGTMNRYQSRLIFLWNAVRRSP